MRWLCGQIKSRLEQHPEIASVPVSLDEHNKTLETGHAISTEDLQELLGVDYHYSIQMKGHESAAPIDIEKANIGLADFEPLILIFLFISIVPAISLWAAGQIDLMLWMNYFMAVFFL